MKTSSIIRFIILCSLPVLFCFFAQKPQKKQIRQESPLARVRRFRAEAPALAQKACSNYVVGITRIVKLDLELEGTGQPYGGEGSRNPTNWTGEAVVEHVNSVGGIERQSLPLRFGTDSRHVPGYDWPLYLICDIDYKAVAEQDRNLTKRRYNQGP